MKNQSLSLPSKIAIGLVLLAGILNIALTYKYSFSVTGTSEFDAMRTAAIGIISLLIIGINSITMLFTIGLYKRKKWAWILAIILLVLIFLLMSIAALENMFENAFLIDLIFTIKLSLPALAIGFLILGRKDFRKSR